MKILADEGSEKTKPIKANFNETKMILNGAEQFLDSSLTEENEGNKNSFD